MMQTVTNNPYRILGVLAGASNREITRQANNLKKYIAAGAEPPVDFSFANLDNLQRTVEAIDDAITRNDTDSEKLENALFWFWKGNEITDEAAFDALKVGDVETAYRIWDELITRTTKDGERFWKSITEKNCSAFHNGCVIEFLRHDTDLINAAVLNIKFIESDYFDEFVKQTVDTTYTVVKKDIELNFLDVVADAIIGKQTKTTLAELAGCLTCYDFAAKVDFLKSIAQKSTTNIIAQIEIACKVRADNKLEAAIAGETLYKNTKDDLARLKEIFGEQDFSYSNVADKVADEVLNCAIDYYNYLNDNEELTYSCAKNALCLAKFAQNIAVGSAAKVRISKDKNTMDTAVNILDPEKPSPEDSGHGYIGWIISIIVVIIWFIRQCS